MLRPKKDELRGRDFVKRNPRFPDSWPTGPLFDIEQASPRAAPQHAIDQQPTAPVLTATTACTVVPVVLTEQSWPFQMCCSWCASDPFDCGLCLYTLLYSTCAAAEISEKIGASGPCNTKSCCEQWWAAYCLTLGASLIGSFAFGIGAIVAPWVWTLYMARVRDTFTRKFRMPPDELCCDAPETTFQPYFICCYCTPCALYQQAYVLKHRAGVDLDCCCYKCCCSACALEMDSVQHSMPLNQGFTAPQPTQQLLF